VRNEPFERSRPKHEQPEANKDGNRKGAKRILINPKYLSYCTENDRYAGKRRYEAERDQQRPRLASLTDRRAKKYGQNRQRARSRYRCRTGQQSN
jgi:hypothetical protein